jgi:hypothetical protein
LIDHLNESLDAIGQHHVAFGNHCPQSGSPEWYFSLINRRFQPEAHRLQRWETSLEADATKSD